MEENKVLIGTSRYGELLISEYDLLLAKQILFSDTRLNYDKKKLYFEISPELVELLFPFEYKLRLEELKGAENV